MTSTALDRLQSRNPGGFTLAVIAVFLAFVRVWRERFRARQNSPS